MPMQPEQSSGTQVSPLHPHEPGIPPAIDAEGRCHVCALQLRVAQLRSAIDVLARLAVEVLDAEREATGVDEWDEADPRCYLYDAAHAVLERDLDRVLGYEDTSAASGEIERGCERVSAAPNTHAKPTFAAETWTAASEAKPTWVRAPQPRRGESGR